MAHEIYIENGKASMMYVGEPPWHGLGTALSEPATAAAAIKAAKLDWTVTKVPLCARYGEKLHDLKDHFATMRADWVGDEKKPIFGIVGKAYTPLQNRDAFGFLDAIVGQGAAIYHTAGALGDGRSVTQSSPYRPSGAWRQRRAGPCRTASQMRSCCSQLPQSHVTYQHRQGFAGPSSARR